MSSEDDDSPVIPRSTRKLVAHGTTPENLVEKILRMKVYDSSFWKESCYALNAQTLLDKATELSGASFVFCVAARARQPLTRVRALSSLVPLFVCRGTCCSPV